jgi:DNA repair exonuclease SbcCD ATPase subunit
MEGSDDDGAPDIHAELQAMLNNLPEDLLEDEPQMNMGVEFSKSIYRDKSLDSSIAPLGNSLYNAISDSISPSKLEIERQIILRNALSRRIAELEKSRTEAESEWQRERERLEGQWHSEKHRADSLLQDLQLTTEELQGARREASSLREQLGATEAQLRLATHERAIAVAEKDAASVAIDSLHEELKQQAKLQAGIFGPLGQTEGGVTVRDMRLQLEHMQSQMAVAAQDSEARIQQYLKELNDKNQEIAELARHVEETNHHLEEFAEREQAREARLMELTESLDHERRSSLALQQDLEVWTSSIS